MSDTLAATVVHNARISGRLLRLACISALLVVFGTPTAHAEDTPCASAAECGDLDSCTRDECTPTENPVPPPNCSGRITAIALRYTGMGCDATTNWQSGQVSCTGGTGGAAPVRIVIQAQNDASVVYGDASNVGIDDRVFGSAGMAGDSVIGTNTRVEIFDAGGDLIEDISFHTSCSKPLDVRDHFGSVEVVGLTTTQGGVQGEGASVPIRCSLVAIPAW